MLNLPLLAPQPAQTAAAAPRKSADARQENDGFSDVYDDMNSADDRPSDDLPEAREAQSDAAEDTSIDGDSSSSQNKASTEDDTPESADFAAIEAETHTEAEPEQPAQPTEKRAAVNASENATLMRMAPESRTQAQAQTASSEALTGQTQAQTQAQTGAPVLKQTATETATTAQTSTSQKTPEVVQDSVLQAAKLASEAAEGLDPMQVQVRSKPAPQNANAAATAVQKALMEAAPQEAGLRPAVQTEVEAEPAQEPVLAKSDAPTAPTVSTTQQMQARAIMEQVQAGIQPVMSKKAENNALSSGESVLSATLDESSLTSRTVMSTQEAASHARLLNSAPNPAYVVRQIAEAANKASDKNMIELTLDPPELGKVRMSMAESGGIMAVTISADSQATTELMRRHMDLLRKDFMEMGYQDVSFSFEQGGSDGSNQQAQMNNAFGQNDSGAQGDSARGNATEQDASVALAAQQNSQLSTANSGVDIRI